MIRTKDKKMLAMILNPLEYKRMSCILVFLFIYRCDWVSSIQWSVCVDHLLHWFCSRRLFSKGDVENWGRWECNLSISLYKEADHELIYLIRS